MVAEEVDDLLRLVEAQQTMIDEDAGELLADRLMQQHGHDRGINAARKPADHARRAHLLADFRDLLLAAALATFGYVRRAPKPLRITRFEVAIPPNVIAIDTPRISPDGRILAFNATDSGGLTRIWVRPLNALAAQPLPGTEGTTRPFWAPDSRFIGFAQGGKLMKIDVSGGPPTKICDCV